jgi:hypothetical protein
MSTFAIKPLHLHLPNVRALSRPLSATQPSAPPAVDPVEQAAEFDASCRPVPASYRDLTIPGVVPMQRSSWRRPRPIRGRAS